MRRLARHLLPGLALAFAALPAVAAVPAETVVLTRAGTVEQRALPSLLSLPEATVSSLELHEAFSLGVWFDSDDVLAYTVGGGPPLRVDPTRFVPPAARARYYDPVYADTRPATVVEATSGGSEASFEVSSSVFTLTDLLAPEGAVLVFAVPAPEPGVGIGLVCTVPWLATMGWRRHARRRLEGAVDRC